MNDSLVRYYLWLAARRLPWVVLACVVGAAASIALALSLPPTYRATGKILVETPQVSGAMAGSTVSARAVTQLEIIIQELTRPDALIDLAGTFHLYPVDDPAARPTVVDAMRKRISIVRDPSGVGDPAESPEVFSISFDAAEPALAANVANEVISRILSMDADRRTSRVDDTLVFFKTRVDALRSRLDTLTSQVMDFKNTHIDALPESLDFRRSQQANLQERLVVLEREEASLRSQRTMLKNLISARNSSPAGDVTTAEGRILSDLKASLARQRMTFREDSPTVVALRRQIETLEAAAPPDTPAEGARPDVRTQISDADLQLAEVEARLVSAAKEKETLEASFDTLSTSIRATPANEAALAKLERDYANAQSAYDSAVARLAEATTARQIEVGLKGERLSLFERADPPLKHFSPKRTRIVAAGTGIALALALGVIGAIELFNRRLRTPDELHRVLDIEPLASIPHFRPARLGWSVRAVAAIAIVGMVAAALPAFVPGWHALHEPVDVFFAQLLRHSDVAADPSSSER